MTKFNVGDKVIFNKENKFVAIKFDYKINKPYEVQNVFEETGCVQIINEKGSSHSFDVDRFELAETKQTKNQRITALENEVAELKLIVHELRERPQLTTVINNAPQEPSTIVEDIIEFEGQQHKKVDREARDGDVVIITKDNGKLPSWFTVGKRYKAFVPKGCYTNNARVIADDNDDLPLYNEGCGRTRETVDVYELIKPKPLTPNQQRAAIIEKAKKFVEQIIERGKNRHSPKVDEGHAYYKNNFYNVDINVKNNKVTALVFLTNPNGKRIHNKPDLINRAICSQNDVFNEHIGKAIALGRALGLDVSEFEQAVQPTVAVGQIINKHWNYEVLTLANENHNLKLTDDGSFANGGDLPNVDWYTIINDTNAIYEV